MPNNAAITINDGADTPVAHVLKPLGQVANGREYVFQEMTDGIPQDAQLAVAIDKRAVSAKFPTSKDQIKITKPKVVTQVVNGVSTSVVSYKDLVTIEFVYSKSSTKQDRKDLRIEAANLLLNAFVASCIDDAETIW